MVIWRRSLVMHTHFLISLTRLVFDLLGHILLHSVFPYERRGGEERGGRWLIEDLKLNSLFCPEFSHSALLVIGGNKPSIKRVNLLFYLICVVVQSATIDWKNAGNQWIFITVTCHHRLRGIRCACI